MNTKKHLFGYRGQTNFMRFWIYFFSILLVLLCVLPVWTVLVNASRASSDIIKDGAVILPGTNLIENAKTFFARDQLIPRAFFNSAFIAVTSTILTVYFSILTAYALEVYDFWGKKFLSRSIVILVLIPMQVSIIGFYQYMNKLHLIDSYIPLIIPCIAAPSSVFFAKQYLESCVVKDLIEAARIDGCSEFGIFNKIMLPIAMPGAFTLAIFSFVASWNNFFTPFIMINSDKKRTIPMIINAMKGNIWQTDFGSVYFGYALSIIPVVIIYSIFAKQIVGGLSMGAVKE